MDHVSKGEDPIRELVVYCTVTDHVTTDKETFGGLDTYIDRSCDNR